MAVFGLGVAASRRGWAADVPARIARQCGAVTLAGAVAMALLVVFVGSQGSVDDALGGATRLHWSSPRSTACSRCSARCGC